MGAEDRVQSINLDMQRSWAVDVGQLARTVEVTPVRHPSRCARTVNPQ